MIYYYNALLILFYFFSCSFSFFCNTTKAQTNATIDSLAFNAAKEYFQNEVKEDSHLYTGEEYVRYAANIQGHAFFNNDQMQNGDIFYDGILYKNIPLLYDIVRQEVVTNNYNKSGQIKLLNQKIKYFKLQGHTFRNFSLVEGSDENITSTIYDEVFEGKASVLARRIKHIKNGLKAEDPTSFVEEDEYYIRNEKNLYAISGKSSVLEAFHNKKESIKIFIRKNKFRFKKNLETELVNTAAYYSTLK